MNRRPCSLLLHLYRLQCRPVQSSGLVENSLNSCGCDRARLEPGTEFLPRPLAPGASGHLLYLLLILKSQTRASVWRAVIPRDVECMCLCVCVLAYLFTDPVLMLSSCAWTPLTGVRRAYWSVLRQVWERATGTNTRSTELLGELCLVSSDSFSILLHTLSHTPLG